MKKIQIFFIIKLTAIILIEINCETSSYKSQFLIPNHTPRIRLRTFAIYSLKTLLQMAKSYEQQIKLQDEMQAREMNIKNEQMSKEETGRRKIFQQYLGSRHFGSSFLTDFHADRFF